MKLTLTAEQKEIKKLKAILDKRNLQILSLTRQNEELDATTVAGYDEIFKLNHKIGRLQNELDEAEEKLTTTTNTLNAERDRHHVNMTEYSAVRDKLQTVFGELRNQRQYHESRHLHLNQVIEAQRNQIAELEAKTKSNEPIELESAD